MKSAWFLFFLAGAACAQDDLDLIPAAPAEPRASDYVAGQRLYLENAFTLSSNRAVPGLAAPFDWQERLLFDIRKEWKLDDQVNLVYSGRFNLRAENDIGTPSHEEALFDLREAYLAWRPADDFYLDAGRINLKSGVALGFNPTDFFKTRSVVEPLSSDPTILREDRLGTLMLRAQYIGGFGSLTVAAAPAVTHATPIYGNSGLHSFDPSFDRTNASNRFLAKGSFTLSDDFSPELLVYRENGRTAYGLNLADNFGQRWVGYLEWSGSEGTGLIEQGGFRNQLSAGASYTTESKITFNVEYHFDQDSLTGTDWRWPLPRELWFVRGLAQDRQEPITRHSLFLRADWVDAFVPRLELTGFINTDLHDGSSLAEANAAYYLSDRWTVGGQLSADLGGRRTDFGSLPQSLTAMAQVTRYF
jgi:hypothetical protein